MARPNWRSDDRNAAELICDLQELGLAPGDTVLVHSSLRRVGTVVGGTPTVLEALRRAVGCEGGIRPPDGGGTIVVPAFTMANSDSSGVFRKATAGMTAAETAAYRATMPAFRPASTPAGPEVGALAEMVRRTPGSRRSSHPQSSFAAIGRLADHVTQGHDPTCHFGERSPLRVMDDLPETKVLLLGTDFSVFSAFHLAEYRVPNPPHRIYRCVVPGPDGDDVWWCYSDVALSDTDFAKLGDAYVAAHPPRVGLVGAAPHFSCRSRRP